MRNACRKDESRGGIRQCANSELVYFDSLSRDSNDYYFQCCAVNGNHTLESSPNADGAGRQSIVVKNVKVQHGVRVIDFGVVRRREMRRLLNPLIRPPTPTMILP